MLGEPGHKGLMVSQAAWIRSLLATFIKSWEGKGHRIGGLFGAPVGAQRETPSWNRAEQAALLIFLGEYMRDAIHEHSGAWAKALRQQVRPAGIPPTLNLAFYGPNTLLNQDQGIRALLYVLNDFLYINADDLGLTEWGGSSVVGTDESGVTEALHSLSKQSRLKEYVESLTDALATYDWRASDAPGLDEQQSLLKAAFRGSGGYRELRRHVLKHLTGKASRIAKTAEEVLKAVG